MLAGETVFGVFMFTDSLNNMEIVARSGVDWVLVDLEHGTASEAALSPMLMATRGTTATALVRVESGERIRVGRVLDLGAEGVMVPQVHSADDAGAVARWMRTQPAGDRGIALFTRGMDYGTVGHAGVAARHEDLLCIVQIESRGALDEVDQIAATDGVDVLFVGPTDLTHALGIPGQLDQPAYQDAISRVGEAARRSGKAAGVLLWKPEDVRRYTALGFTFFGLSSEAMILDRAVRSALDVARAGVAVES
ncbi:MAG: HpcH/HpaI aldolase/citrate lyase family protein [Chloroflexota bacterium]